MRRGYHQPKRLVRKVKNAIALVRRQLFSKEKDLLECLRNEEPIDYEKAGNELKTALFPSVYAAYHFLLQGVEPRLTEKSSAELEKMDIPLEIFSDFGHIFPSGLEDLIVEPKRKEAQEDS